MNLRFKDDVIVHQRGINGEWPLCVVFRLQELIETKEPITCLACLAEMDASASSSTKE